jgi:AraC-like DNA-binding protein
MHKRKTPRNIGDVMRWSPGCRDHFFPWLTKAADVMKAQAIAEAGITEAYPGYHLERSAPRFHLLVYTTEGTGEIFDSSISKRVGAGQILITPAHKPFGYRPATEKWRFMWFHLPDNETWAFLRDKSLSIRETLLCEPLRKATEEFLRESRGRTDSHLEASKLYINLIALYIRRDLGHGNPGTHTETGNRLDYLCAMINADLAHRWDVKTLADTLGVSPPHLHRMVRERFGASPMKLVTRLRMERAQEWLIIYDTPQSVIGEMVGYQNEFAFLVAFKRFAGVTPKEFRKRR